MEEEKTKKPKLVKVDALMEVLTDSDNADIALIAKTYPENKKQYSEHYKTNGSLLISAIFRGDLEDVRELCSEHDLDLLKEAF